jgi:transposase-like protein
MRAQASRYGSGTIRLRGRASVFLPLLMPHAARRRCCLTRKAKAVTEELFGHEFSASSISAINKKLDASLKAFSERRLEEAFPYVILDARYERIREAGVIASQAVLIAVAVDWEGRRQVLAVELANRESPAGPGRTFCWPLKDVG